MNTKIFLIPILFLSLNSFAQEKLKISSTDNLDIFYQLLLIDEGAKKDKYTIIITAVNKSNKNLYYSVDLIKNSEGELILSPFGGDLGFFKVVIRNAKGLFGNGQSIIADQTNFITTSNQLLFKVKKGGGYSNETNFKVKHRVKPMVTGNFTKGFNELSSYDLKITAEMITGYFISSCGNLKINLKVLNDNVRGDYLVQTINEKQFIWLRKSENSFIRENSNDYTLTFNKKTKAFQYSTTDGIFCEWTKVY